MVPNWLIFALFVIGVGIIGAVVTYYLFREPPVRATDPTVRTETPAPIQVAQQIDKALLSQQSLLWGALISLALISAIDWTINAYLLRPIGIYLPLGAHLVFVLTLASLNFLWGLHHTELGFRGAIIFLRRRLLRQGKGLSEGWQWVQRPFFSIRDVDCKEKPMQIGDAEGSYSLDGVLMSTTSFMQYAVVDPYRYLGKDRAEDSLQGLGRQSVRVEVKKQDALKLRNANKVDFSDLVATELESQLVQKGNPRGIEWGFDTGVVVVEDIYATDEDISKAWSASVRERAEGEAEQIQIDRRRQQAEALIKLDPVRVDPNHAITAAMADAGKEGARSSSFNIPGLDRIASAIERGIVTGIERLGR